MPLWFLSIRCLCPIFYSLFKVSAGAETQIKTVYCTKLPCGTVGFCLQLPFSCKDSVRWSVCSSVSLSVQNRDSVYLISQVLRSRQSGLYTSWVCLLCCRLWVVTIGIRANGAVLRAVWTGAQPVTELDFQGTNDSFFIAPQQVVGILFLDIRYQDL